MQHIIKDPEKHLPSIDWKLSLKLTGGNLTLAKNLFTMIINSLPTEQQLINSAFINNDLNQLYELIHKLYGGCCYIGLPKLKYIVKNLEQENVFSRQLGP